MRRIILLTLSVLFPLAVFSPALWTLLWHLRRGDVIEYNGMLIPVPQRWYTTTQFRTLYLTKLPLTIFFLDGPPLAWSFWEPAPMGPSVPPEETYRSFESLYWTLRAKKSDLVTGPIRMGSGEYEAICMKSSPRENKSHVSASCLLFQGKWMAEFIGDERDLDTFFQIIRGSTSALGQGPSGRGNLNKILPYTGKPQ